MDVCMMCGILPLGAWNCTSGCNKEVAALFNDSCRKIQQLLYTMHYFCSVKMQAYILPAHVHVLFCIITKFVRGSCIYLVTCTLYSSAIMYILDFTVACIQFSQLSTLVVLHLLLAGFPRSDLLHPGQTLPPLFLPSLHVICQHLVLMEFWCPCLQLPGPDCMKCLYFQRVFS